MNRKIKLLELCHRRMRDSNCLTFGSLLVMIAGAVRQLGFEEPNISHVLFAAAIVMLTKSKILMAESYEAWDAYRTEIERK